MYMKYLKFVLILFFFKNGDVFIIIDFLECVDIKFLLNDIRRVYSWVY